MIRKNVIKLISQSIGNSPIISANGYISRDLYEVDDKESNFYMIGSMGLSSSIALGISLNYTKKKIYVFDGDGNILMNLGSLVTVAGKKPKNFIHFVFEAKPPPSHASDNTTTPASLIIFFISVIIGPLLNLNA